MPPHPARYPGADGAGQRKSRWERGRGQAGQIRPAPGRGVDSQASPSCRRVRTNPSDRAHGYGPRGTCSSRADFSPHRSTTTERPATGSSAPPLKSSPSAWVPAVSRTGSQHWPHCLGSVQLIGSWWARKLRCCRSRSAATASSVSPSAPQFQDRLSLSPSLPSSPLASLCLSLTAVSSMRRSSPLGCGSTGATFALVGHSSGQAAGDRVRAVPSGVPARDGHLRQDAGRPGVQRPRRGLEHSAPATLPDRRPPWALPGLVCV
jgi:hypothetical protein